MPIEVKFEVVANLDPMYGAFHSPESARDIVQQILNDRIEHYHPKVKIVAVTQK